MPTQIIGKDPAGMRFEHVVEEAVGSVTAKINRAVKPGTQRRFITFEGTDGKQFSVEAAHVENINEVD